MDREEGKRETFPKFGSKGDKNALLSCSLTQLKPVSAVDVEVVVAGLPLPAEGVKDETVRAEPLLRDAVVTLVVLVTLLGVLVGAVGLLADQAAAALAWKRTSRE